jgi:hypothetical protein
MPDGTEDEMSKQQWRRNASRRESLHGRHWDLVTRSQEEFDDIDEDYFSEYL